MKFTETESVELKERLNDSFAREVVSFLNTHSGTIYIGITDDGEVIGVNNVDETLKSISNTIVDSINPSCKEFVKPMAVLEEGKLIVKVEVSKGTTLYYIKSKGLSESGCFIRVGTSCRGLNDAEIKERYEATLNIPELKLVNQESMRTDLTFRILKTYLSNNNIHINDETFNKNFNLLAPSGKFNKMAELLADENTESIKIAVFKGKTKAYFLKRNEYGNTCLISALEKVTRYAEALNETYVDVSVRPRREKHLFNIEAFKEAWINACVHNKWTEGIPPAVYWFDDRLEIISYGGIPKGLTREGFLSGETQPVNEELMKIFLQCDIVDQSGHGGPNIVREYGEKAYKFSKNSITVTIPFDRIGFNTDIGEINGEISLEVVVVRLIQGNPNINRKQLAVKSGVSERSIDRVIESLKKKGIIQGKTSNKNGKWILKK